METLDRIILPTSRLSPRLDRDFERTTYSRAGKGSALRLYGAIAAGRRRPLQARRESIKWTTNCLCCWGCVFSPISSTTTGDLETCLNWECPTVTRYHGLGRRWWEREGWPGRGGRGDDGRAAGWRRRPLGRVQQRAGPYWLS